MKRERPDREMEKVRRGQKWGDGNDGARGKVRRGESAPFSFIKHARTT